MKKSDNGKHDAKRGKGNAGAKPQKHGNGRGGKDTLGAMVWVLTIVGRDGLAWDGDVTTAVYTSFDKALDEVKTIFHEEGEAKEWKRAEKELREQFYFTDPTLFGGDRFVIDCERVH